MRPETERAPGATGASSPSVKGGDACLQALDCVEPRPERLVAAIEFATQMTSQRAIIDVFGKDPLFQHCVQRTNPERRGLERVEDALRRDAMAGGDEAEFRREDGGARVRAIAPMNPAVENRMRRAPAQRDGRPLRTLVNPCHTLAPHAAAGSRASDGELNPVG
jgi:hypothetical protein